MFAAQSEKRAAAARLYRSLITLLPSPIHGTGAFAMVPITQGTRLLEYRGRRISKGESQLLCESGNPFIFYLNEELDLDGDVPWNEARALNHSCAPNCQAERIRDRIWIVSTRAIHAGEELTFDYGYDLTHFREHPCHCGAPGCAGFILAEEFRSVLPGGAGQF